MIIEIPNFFDPRLCNFLITYFHEAKRVPAKPGVEIVPLFDHCNSTSVKKLYNTLARHGMEYYGDSHYISFWIISRHANGMFVPSDKGQEGQYLGVYLNDHFTGGETNVEGVNIDVAVGKAVTFPANSMEHGINEIKGAPRYTLDAWWSPL